MYFIVFAQEGEQKKVSDTTIVINSFWHLMATLTVTLIKFTFQKHGFSIFAFTDPLAALEHFNLNLKEYL